VLRFFVTEMNLLNCSRAICDRKHANRVLSKANVKVTTKRHDFYVEKTNRDQKFSKNFSRQHANLPIVTNWPYPCIDLSTIDYPYNLLVRSLRDDSNLVWLVWVGPLLSLGRLPPQLWLVVDYAAIGSVFYYSFLLELGRYQLSDRELSDYIHMYCFLNSPSIQRSHRN